MSLCTVFLLYSIEAQVSIIYYIVVIDPDMYQYKDFNSCILRLLGRYRKCINTWRINQNTISGKESNKVTKPLYNYNEDTGDMMYLEKGWLYEYLWRSPSTNIIWKLTIFHPTMNSRVDCWSSAGVGDNVNPERRSTIRHLIFHNFLLFLYLK